MFLRLWLAAGVCAALTAAAQEGGPGWSRWSVSPGAGILFAGGGQRIDGAAQASLGIGYDWAEFWTVEAGGSWAPYVKGRSTGNPDIYGVSAEVLYHLDSYTSFDPYLAFGAGYYGASGKVFRDGRARGMTGPRAGFGMMYHLSEEIALRADARAFMAADSGREMAYLVSVGMAFHLP